MLHQYLLDGQWRTRGRSEQCVGPEVGEEGAPVHCSGRRRAVAEIRVERIEHPHTELPEITHPTVGSTLRDTKTSFSHASIASALALSCSRVISMPACISPMVTADTNSRSAACSPTQRTTARFGRGRRNSDITFVSRRNTSDLALVLVEFRSGAATMWWPRRSQCFRTRLRRE